MRRRPEPITAAEVRAVRIQATKFREGYDQDEIDAFLARAAEALEAKASGRQWTHLLTRDGVLSAKFQSTKFREGYDQDQVDDLLDRVGASLAPDGAPVQAQPAPFLSQSAVGRPLTPRGVLGLAIVAVILGVVIYFVVLAN
jgi:DivIVA domain-containing protein